jgi:hypothetical protein
MLEPGGVLYLSVPSGHRQRVEFNAHRVFSVPFLRDHLAENLMIDRFSFVTDSGELLDSVDPYGADAELSFGARFGCGIWFLTKPR